MKYCPTCHTENDEDAFYCKKCGFSFAKKEDNDLKRPKSKTKVKQKTRQKHHTKVKHVREKKDVEKKMSLLQKIIMLFLIVLSIVLLGLAAVFGYYIYQTNNIVVPNVIGYSYEEAIEKLQEAKLSYKKVEKVTDDKDVVGTIVKQSKNSGTKVKENTVIQLTVGILDTQVTIPKVVGMNINDAISTLNYSGISYKIVYEKSSKEQNVVLKQSLKAGKKIQTTEQLVLTVADANSDTDDEVVDGKEDSAPSPSPESTPNDIQE